MQSIIRFFINSNIWVAFCIFGLTISSEILLESTNFKISQFVFFATIFAYNFQRIVRIRKGHSHFYKAWLDKNKHVTYCLVFIAAVLSAYLFFDFKSNTQIAILFTGAISVFYPFGIRGIPFVKIFVISFVWAVSAMLLLVLENSIPVSQNIVLHLIARFLFVFAITIPFDIRDLKYDVQNLRTIPLSCGTLRSQFIAVFSLVICGVISIFQYLDKALIFSNLVALLLLYFLSSIFILKSDENKGEMYFSFWIESLSILGYLFLVIMLLIF